MATFPALGGLPSSLKFKGNCGDWVQVFGTLCKYLRPTPQVSSDVKCAVDAIAWSTQQFFFWWNSAAHWISLEERHGAL